MIYLYSKVIPPLGAATNFVPSAWALAGNESATRGTLNASTVRPPPLRARAHALRMAPPSTDNALDTLHEISTLLETGLDKETLAILVALCEQGVNPEALAAVVKELRREAAALRAAEEEGAAAADEVQAGGSGGVFA